MVRPREEELAEAHDGEDEAIGALRRKPKRVTERDVNIAIRSMFVMEQQKQLSSVLCLKRLYMTSGLA